MARKALVHKTELAQKKATRAHELGKKVEFSTTDVLTAVVLMDILVNSISVVFVSVKKQMPENLWVYANQAGNYRRIWMEDVHFSRTLHSFLI
mgnify:CR=1 FL=1